MRYLDGCKLREIADEIGCAVGSVAGLLRRGIDKIRAELPESFGDVDSA